MVAHKDHIFTNDLYQRFAKRVEKCSTGCRKRENPETLKKKKTNIESQGNTRTYLHQLASKHTQSSPQNNFNWRFEKLCRKLNSLSKR
jgi:hypothetical protein